jgi:hypothetical protein
LGVIAGGAEAGVVEKSIDKNSVGSKTGLTIQAPDQY